MPRPNAGPRLKLDPKAKVYEIHWTENGRSRRESTRTRDAEKAAIAFRDWKQDVERDKAAVEAATVRGVLEAYWMRARRGKLRQHGWLLEVAEGGIAPHFADMHPAEITPADVRAYRQKRRSGEIGGRVKAGVKRGVQNPTIRRDLTMLVAALNHAVEEGRTKRGEVPAISLPPENEPRVRWLNDDELARLFEAAAEISADRGRMCRIERWLFLAYYTARRKRAIEQLAWDRVDFELNERGLRPARPPQDEEAAWLHKDASEAARRVGACLCGAQARRDAGNVLALGARPRRRRQDGVPHPAAACRVRPGRNATCTEAHPHAAAR